MATTVVRHASTQAKPKSIASACDPPQWSTFETKLGWVGLQGTPQGGLLRTLIGYASAGALLQAIHAADPSPDEMDDWSPDLRQRITRHLAGKLQDFQDVPVAARRTTPFQQRVVDELRRVPSGATLSYRELAERAGRPAAARAVGQVMATNPVPLIIPCHRVLASGGLLGGFSAPTGLNLKRALLELEGVKLPS